MGGGPVYGTPSLGSPASPRGAPRQDGFRTPALRAAPVRPPPRPAPAASVWRCGRPGRARGRGVGRPGTGRARGRPSRSRWGNGGGLRGGARPAQGHRPARRVHPARGPKQPRGPAPAQPRHATPGGGLTAATRSAFAPRRAPRRGALRVPGGCGRRFHFRRAQPISARRRQPRSRWAARPASAPSPGPPRRTAPEPPAPPRRPSHGLLTGEATPGARVPRTPRDHRRAGSSGRPRTAPGTHFRRGASRSARPSRCPRVHLRPSGRRPLRPGRPIPAALSPSGPFRERRGPGGRGPLHP